MSTVVQTNYSELSKSEKYEIFQTTWPTLWDPNLRIESNLCNCYALMRQIFQWWWVGNYWVNGDNLVLGVFQGDPACTQIEFGKGVCGNSWKNQETIIVPNVHDYPGHIACSALSNSEIVIPIFNKSSRVIGVLDIDSKEFNDFDLIDREQLEIFCSKLAELLS